jgi:hypothetical protein
VYAHGYATLSFDADVCSADYFQSVGGGDLPVYSEQFS